MVGSEGFCAVSWPQVSVGDSGVREVDRPEQWTCFLSLFCFDRQIATLWESSFRFWHSPRLARILHLGTRRDGNASPSPASPSILVSSTRLKSYLYPFQNGILYNKEPLLVWKVKESLLGILMHGCTHTPDSFCCVVSVVHFANSLELLIILTFRSLDSFWCPA